MNLTFIGPLRQMGQRPSSPFSSQDCKKAKAQLLQLGSLQHAGFTSGILLLTMNESNPVPAQVGPSSQDKVRILANEPRLAW